MTVQTLIDKLGLTVFHLEDPDQTVAGGYCGDLLSWVMGRAGTDSMWLTIMSNVNVAAVAALSDVACVTLTEGVSPDPDLLARAQAQGITLLGSSRSTYDTAVALAEALKEAQTTHRGGRRPPLSAPSGSRTPHHSERR